MTVKVLADAFLFRVEVDGKSLYVNTVDELETAGQSQIVMSTCVDAYNDNVFNPYDFVPESTYDVVISHLGRDHQLLFSRKGKLTVSSKRSALDASEENKVDVVVYFTGALTTTD